MPGHASTLPVIPAKAGIQCLGNFLKALDSSFRWNDGQKKPVVRNVANHAARTSFHGASLPACRH